MANSTENIMNNIPFRVVDPERIPAKRYHDEEFFKLEQERLWPHVWQMACRLEEIPEIGDYAEYRILDKSVIVVRTATEVKAFHNACRHRGVELASGSGNCKSRGFVCPLQYGWREYLCVRQARLQRGEPGAGGTESQALPRRALGGIRLHQL